MWSACAKCCSKENPEDEEKSSKWDIINRLPILHEIQSWKVCGEAKELKLLIAQMEEEQDKMTDEDEQEKIQLEINFFKNSLEKLMSKSRIDKSYQAILESGLQYLLQSSIAYQKYGAFGFDAFSKTDDRLIKAQIATSLFSIFIGFVKMYDELPYQMDGAMTTNKETIKSTYKELKDESSMSWKSWIQHKSKSWILDGYIKFFCTYEGQVKNTTSLCGKQSTMWFNIANKILNPFTCLGVIFENSSCPVAKPSGKDPIYFCFIELVPSISRVTFKAWPLMNESWFCYYGKIWI